MKFTALAIKKANESDASLCSVGVAVFEAGELSETRHWFVSPPEGHAVFRDDFFEIHGITHEHVRKAPEFPGIWPELDSFFTKADFLVGYMGYDPHEFVRILNHFRIAPTFECCLNCYRLSESAWPDLSDHSLKTVAAHVGYVTHNKGIQDDAEAIGRIFFAIIKEHGEKWVLEHF